MRLLSILLIITASVVSVSFSQLCPNLGVVKDGQVVCYSKRDTKGGNFIIEERYNLNLPIVRGTPTNREYEIFKARAGGRWGSPVGACGLNVFANYLYGIKQNIEALKMFIRDWKQAGTAVALYGLATMLPVAKEVLLGAEMMSNAVAKLKGFNCRGAMKMLRDMNMVDSVLVKRCVLLKAEREGISGMDYETLMDTEPSKWERWYRECVESPSIFDQLDLKSVKAWEKKVSIRRSIRCAFFGDKSKNQVLRNVWKDGSLDDKAKVLLYIASPEIEMGASVEQGGQSLASVRFGGEDPNFGPGTPVDIRKLIDEMLSRDLAQDVSLLLDAVVGAYRSCTTSSGSCPDAIDALDGITQDFERKWNVDLSGILPELELIARVESILMESKREDGLAALIAEMHNTWLKRVKKQVYLEVRSQILTKLNDLTNNLRMRATMGTSADLCNEGQEGENST